MKQRDEYIVDEKTYNPRAINLVCDATFYGKRKDKLGTLVFKDVESKEILIWKHIESETVQDCKYLKEHGIVQSMSRKGDCWDNAVSESFFACKQDYITHKKQN